MSSVREIDGKQVWLVQFDEGGKLYTYHKTQDEFLIEMQDRTNGGREIPYRIWLVTEARTVKLRQKTEEELKGSTPKGDTKNSR